MNKTAPNILRSQPRSGIPWFEWLSWTKRTHEPVRAQETWGISDITKQIWGFKKPRWRSKSEEIMGLKLFKEANSNEKGDRTNDNRWYFQDLPSRFRDARDKMVKHMQSICKASKAKQFGQEWSFHRSTDTSKKHAPWYGISSCWFTWER